MGSTIIAWILGLSDSWMSVLLILYDTLVHFFPMKSKFHAMSYGS